MSQALRKPPADVLDPVPPEADFEEGKPLSEAWVNFDEIVDERTFPEFIAWLKQRASE